MNNFKKSTYCLIIFFLFTTSYSFAEQQDDYQCDFDFKAIEAYVMKGVPSSSVLSRKSDGKEGEVLLKVDGVQEFILGYYACVHHGVTIEASQIDPLHLDETLDFIQRLIRQGPIDLDEIFESLKSHIKAGKIVALEVSSRYFSHMTIAIRDNDDETLNIKIHTSGG